jgi:hypothetical protein
MKRVICGLVITLLSLTTAQAQSLPEGSIWKNGRDSVLIVSKVDTTKNTFIGTFINHATGFPQCQGVGVPVFGSIATSGVTFVANFGVCSNTITVWKGTVSGSTLTTNYDLWYVDNNFDFQEDKQSDVFTKQ